MQQVATDVFGNALGQSIAAVASQVSTAGSSVQEDRLGAFIQENLGAWTQRQANYDQLVDSFGNYTADSRADGVQLAAGADYTGGIGSGLSDREANIARMLKLANDPQAMGSLRGPDGIYRLEITGIGSTGAGDGTRWIPDTDSLGGTVAGKRMTQAEMDEFDRLNAAEMIDAKAARYGSITPNQPSVSERTWLSPSVQYAVSNSFTGQLVRGLVNAAGSISASIRADRYNFATGKYLNPVEQRNARIDNLINLAALPFGSGAIEARSALQGMRAARFGSVDVAATGASMRNRVLANIEASRVANSSSQFEFYATVEDLLNKRIDLGLTSNAKMSRNFAYSQYELNGQAGGGFALSGKSSPTGTVSIPENRMFTTIQVGWDRAYDTDVKLLESVAQQYNPQRLKVVDDITGSINLYSELTVCYSCSRVIGQFQEMFPNVKLNVQSGANASKPFFR